MTRLMEIQHRAKRAVKPLILPSGRAPRRVRFGAARGLTLVLDRQHDLQREFGLWERETHLIYRAALRGGGVAYDVGAGDGDTSLTLANVGADRVVAFEPDPAALARFRANLGLNPTLCDRIELIDEPLGEESRLDALPAPRFVKVDVDGAELDVLTALAPILEGDQPEVLVEVHGQDLEALTIRHLQAVGYGTRVLRNAGWRRVYPEYRPLGHNRWVHAIHPTVRTRQAPFRHSR